MLQENVEGSTPRPDDTIEGLATGTNPKVSPGQEPQAPSPGPDPAGVALRA